MGGYRNHALSGRAVEDISKGYALVMTVLGSIELANAATDQVIGWATRDVETGKEVDVRTMYDGTIEVAITIDTAIVRGTALYLAADGTMTDDNTAGGPMLGYALEDAVSGQLYVEALILRQLPYTEEVT